MRHLYTVILASFIATLSGVDCFGQNASSPPGYIFWGSHVDNALKRTNLDGQELTTIVETLFTPTDIATDSEGEKVYWCDETSRAIYSANYDGSAYGAVVETPLPPLAVAVDESSKEVFWIDAPGNCKRVYGGDPFPGTPGVPEVADPCKRRILKYDPSKPHAERALGDLHFPDLGNAIDPSDLHGLYYDSTDDKLYWLTDNRLMRSNLDGSEAETIVVAPGSVLAFDVAPSVNKVCYAAYQRQPGDSSLYPSIVCTNLDGSSAIDISPIGNFYGTPSSVRIDSAGMMVYWIEGKEIIGAEISEDPEPTSVYSSGTLELPDFVLDPSTGYFYVALIEKSSPLGGYARTIIKRLNNDWTSSADITTNYFDTISHRARSIWLQDGYLYWHETQNFWEQDPHFNPSVVRIPISGGDVELSFQIALGIINDFSLSRTSFFPSTTPGKVFWKEPHRIGLSNTDGSGNETVISEPSNIFAEGTKVYLLKPEGIFSVNLDGTNLTELVASDTYPGEFVVDTSAGYLFWSDANTRDIMRSSLTGTNKIIFLSRETQAECWEIAGDLANHNLYCKTPSSLRRTPMNNPNAILTLGNGAEVNYLSVDGQANAIVYGTPFSDDSAPFSSLIKTNLNGSGALEIGDTNQEGGTLGINSKVFATKSGYVIYEDLTEYGMLVKQSLTNPADRTYHSSEHSLDFGNYWRDSLLLDYLPDTNQILWRDSLTGVFYIQALEDMFELVGEAGTDVIRDKSQSLTYTFRTSTLDAKTGFSPVNLAVFAGALDPAAPGFYYIKRDEFTEGSQIAYYNLAYSLGWDLGSLNPSGPNRMANITYLPQTSFVYWSDGWNTTTPDLYSLQNGPNTSQDSTFEGGAIHRLNPNDLTTTVLISAERARYPLGIGAVTIDITAQTYTISGLVTIDSEPASNQIVIGGATIGSATTQSNGAYSFTEIVQGTSADMSVTAPGYTFVEESSRPLQFTVNADATRNFVGTPNKIRGYARYGDVEGNPPASGVTIGNGYLAATTNAGGYYELVAVPNGTYLVQGFLSGKFVEPAAGDGTVTISDNSQVVDFLVFSNEVNPPPVETYSVSGYVRISGERAPGQEVNGGGSLGTTSTDNQGTYEFVGLSSGTPVDLSVTRPGYYFQETSGLPLNFTLTENAVRNFEGEPNRIFGKVRFANFEEEPAPGVTVVAGGMQATSNSEGSFEIVAIPNGTYTVLGSLPGYRVEVEEGINPLTIENGSQEVNLWVYPLVSPMVFGPWNGFLGVTAVVEVVNTGTEPLEVKVTLYGMEGSRVSEKPTAVKTRIKGGEQRDFIVNDMIGFEEDRYGIVKVEFTTQYYNGRITYYKPDQDAQVSWRSSNGKEFDYVFANPFVSPVKGKSFVSFNTYQPSRALGEGNYLVPNWLTIINSHETEPRLFKVRKYDERGTWLEVTNTVGTVQQNCRVVEGDLLCKVQPMGRIDVDGGHVSPGPQRVGLLEITPLDEDTPYSANLIRYGMKSTPDIYTEDYAFGMYFQTSAGSTRTQSIPVWTGDSQENWVEVVNVDDTKTLTRIELVNSAGETLQVIVDALQPRATRHYFVGDYMSGSQTGIVRIKGTDGNVIAQSVAYYRNQLTDAMSATLSLQAREQYSKTIYGTYNRFLSAYQWLKVVNLTGVERQVTLAIDNGQNFILTLDPYSGLDIPLHESVYGIMPNTIGSFSLQDTQPAKIFANLIRMKVAPSGETDFVLGTDVE